MIVINFRLFLPKKQKIKFLLRAKVYKKKCDKRGLEVLSLSNEIFSC